MKDAKNKEIKIGDTVEFLGNKGKVYFLEAEGLMAIEWEEGTPDCINHRLFTFIGTTLKVIKSKSENFKKEAQTLGRKGGKARLRTMTAEQRKEIAKKAIKARWKKYQENQPNEK